MTKLPFLISISHGGNKIPQELIDRVCLTETQLFDDSDAYTREIYDIRDCVSEVITTDIYRAIVDVNRSPEDLSPQNPDGVIKTKTCYGLQVYKAGQELDKDLTDDLVHRYYIPYHKKIRRALHRNDIQLALDCHSMAAVGPAISPDTGTERPEICLSNAEGMSCNFDIVEKLADCMRTAFSTNDIAINKPFVGGYITRHYGMNPVPWIQVELNRNLYLVESWFDKQSMEIDNNKLIELKTSFKEALICFFEKCRLNYKLSK